MRPYTDTNASSSTSSAYQSNQFNGGRQSHSQHGQQTHDSDQHSARMHTRAPSSHPLQIDEAHQENKQSTDQLSSEQEYEQAQRRLGTLKYFVNQLNGAKEFDLAEAIALFKQIKSTDTALKLLAREGSEDDRAGLQQFGAGMTTCINRFERFLASGKLIKPGLQVDGISFPAHTLLSSLDAEDVHQVFNGLSTLIDDSLHSHLMSRAQFEKLGKPLREINHALLVQAMLKGLPADLPSNACLLDILNLQSRGLKSKLLHEDSKLIRALFGRALAIIEQWPTETGTPVTEAGKIVSRQLAKTLVQLNTIKSFNLIKLDKSATGQANKRRLGQLVLALCNEAALDELALKHNPKNHEAKPVRVQPKGVEVTNTSNTVKDFLEAGYLALSDSKTQKLVEGLCKLINQIPQADMQQRSGQTLGNIGNFLRVVLECTLREKGEHPILQLPAFQTACSSMLTTAASASFWKGMDWHGKPDQTLTNSASFLKAMDKSLVKLKQVDPRLLQTASVMLVQQIQGYGAEYITDAQSVSSLLSALIVINTLAPKSEVPALINTMLQTVVQGATNKWPAKSRALALRAALTWLAKGRSLQANPAIDVLLNAGAVIDDALPYLQAMRLRINELAKRPQEHADRLHEFQPMLRQLMPARANNPEPISLSEIEQAISHLEAGEPVASERELLADVDTVASSATTTSSASTSSTSAQAPQPTIPGLTPLRTESTASSSNAFTATTTSSTVKPTARSRKADTSDEAWEVPANVLGNQKPTQKPEQKPTQKSAQKSKKAAVFASTEPLITVVTSLSDTTANSGSKSVPKKGSRAHASGSGSTTNLEMPEVSAPSGLGNRAKATMERQWFDVIRNKGMKSRMQVLEKLVHDYPELPTITDSKSGSGQTALFDAMVLGDPALVEWLLGHMQAFDHDSAYYLLMAVFKQPIVVTEAMKAAVQAFLSRLDKHKSETISLIFHDYSNLAPVAYQGILKVFKPVERSLDQIATPSSSTASTSKAATTPHSDKPLRDQVAKNDESKNAKQDMPTPSQDIEFVRKIEQSVNKAKGRNPLLAAALHGDLASVNTLLELPHAATLIGGVENYKYLTPLMLAIFNGHENVVERLLQTDAGKSSATNPDTNGCTPLLRALQNGHNAIASRLLALPSVLTQTQICDPSTKMNPMLVAVRKKNHTLARQLADIQGAEDQVLQSDTSGFNALHIAIINDDQPMIDILLAMPNATQQLLAQGGKEKSNALNLALMLPRMASVNKLLQRPEAQQMITAPTLSGLDAITYAFKKDLHPVLETMLNSNYGKRLSMSGSFGEQIPLMTAASVGNEKIARLLLKMDNADLQSTRVNDAGLTALMLATMYGRINIVQQLIALPNAAEQARKRVSKPNAIQKIQTEIENANPTERFDIARKELLMSVTRHAVSQSFGVPVEAFDKTIASAELDMESMNAWQIATAKGFTKIAALLLPFEKS
jgi:ankyrin repeat protein